MRVTATRMLAVILFAAMAASAAQARQHGKASASRHAHHHHPATSPAPSAAAGNAAAAANAGGANGERPDRGSTIEPSDNGPRAVATDRDHRGPIPHPESAAAMAKGHIARPAQHDVNVDLIFVPPAGRGAKRAVIKPANSKKSVAAVPSAPIGYRRQRLDPAAGAAAKNAIGAVTGPAGARAHLNASTIGAAAKTNAIGAHLAPQGSALPAPDRGARTGLTVNPAAHPAAGPAAVASFSTHGAGINGTGFGRTVPGTIGGPAKPVAGISGTGVRLKR